MKRLAGTPEMETGETWIVGFILGAGKHIIT